MRVQRGGVEHWQVRSGRAPLWKSVSQGGRIFGRSATRRCCVLQFVEAGTLLQDRRTSLADVLASNRSQITHPSVIQRAPEYSCQQRLSSCNALTHGHNIVLLDDCQRISQLESTACVVFFRSFFFCERAGVCREHQFFAAASAVCF